MPIVEKINSFVTKKGDSTSAPDDKNQPEQSEKMEKTNNVDVTKDGNKDAAQPVGKRTAWQRLKDKVWKTYSDKEPLISMIGAISLTILIPLFNILGALVNPYFFIPLGVCCIIFVVLAVLSSINERKIKRDKLFS